MVNVLFYLPQSLDHQKSKFIIVFQITFFKKMEIKKKKKLFDVENQKVTPLADTCCISTEQLK